MTLKTGPELMAEIAKFPTIDIVLDRHPNTLTPEMWKDQIERFRLERALFTVREQEKKAKKRGEKDDDNGTSE